MRPETPIARAVFPPGLAPAHLPAAAELCSVTVPYARSPALDALFTRAMNEITAWHAERSPFYRNLLAREGVRPGELRDPADCARLPSVPAEFFKQHEALSIPRSQVEITLTSSGTTGQKSQMFFDAWSIRAPQRMVESHFDDLGWHTPDAPANYLLYTYEVESDSRLGTAYTDNFLCRFAPVRDVRYALRRDGRGGHDFDVNGCIRALQDFAARPEPVRIFGFPAFLYFTLERMRALGQPPLKLPEGSLVFLGGGWKGHASQSVSPAALRSLAQELLGLDPARVRDGFGSVEHCIPYVECARHRFHVPVWSRVVIRDVATLAPAPLGQPGFLQFISPYITSVPAHSVMMGDLASLHPADECGCGIATPFFRVLGRAGTSRNKSCAVSASELLRGFGGGNA